MLLVMASSRAGLHLVSGHMAWAGSEGPAKNSRNAETKVAMMTLRARAIRLRMYVSTFCLPNKRGGRRWWGPGKPRTPTTRLSDQVLLPGRGAVTADSGVEPHVREVRHTLVRVVVDVLDLRAEDRVALVVVVRDGEEVVLREPLVHLAPLRALLRDRELLDALDLGVDLGVGEVAEGRAALREGDRAEGGRDDGVGGRPVEAPATRRLQHVVLALGVTDELATLLVRRTDVLDLEAGLLERLLADLVHLLRGVVVVRVVVDELER